MSASAGATPWIFVYAWMKAKYCPCNFVNRGTDSSSVAERLKAHRRQRRSRWRPVQRRVRRPIHFGASGWLPTGHSRNLSDRGLGNSVALEKAVVKTRLLQEDQAQGG